jgi:hypothetical protein
MTATAVPLPLTAQHCRRREFEKRHLFMRSLIKTRTSQYRENDYLPLLSLSPYPLCVDLYLCILLTTCSVADPGCLSRILIITHPGSRIPDPKTATKERGEKKLVVKLLFVATNFTKLNIILFLKC